MPAKISDLPIGNPSAFPSPPNSLVPGMTLRDYFAGQALAGYFAHPTTPHMNATDAGAYCYAMADAMLTARQEPTS